MRHAIERITTNKRIAGERWSITDSASRDILPLSDQLAAEFLPSLAVGGEIGRCRRALEFARGRRHGLDRIGYGSSFRHTWLFACSVYQGAPIHATKARSRPGSAARALTGAATRPYNKLHVCDSNGLSCRAGPGHPGLLTLRGAECLRRADLVLYDKLVSPLLLEHAPAHAEKHCVVELRRTMTNG